MSVPTAPATEIAPVVSSVRFDALPPVVPAMLAMSMAPLDPLPMPRVVPSASTVAPRLTEAVSALPGLMLALPRTCKAPMATGLPKVLSWPCKLLGPAVCVKPPLKFITVLLLLPRLTVPVVVSVTALLTSSTAPKKSTS